MTRRRAQGMSSPALHEFNPMMGHRGCRLAVTYPEIAEMQTTADHQGRHQRQEGASGTGHRCRRS